MDSSMAPPEPVLPPIQAVLDRLKSNGTFDQFRKTCLAAIEEEPSYRAQKEHVEILSRRFLHDYETKEMSKNEVRTKLRLSVLEELKKPGVQASHTIEELVENTLESKSAKLFGNILEIVNTMLHPPEPHPPPLPDKQLESRGHMPNHLEGVAPVLAPPTASTFELPIDLLTLPGLSSSSTTNIKREMIKKATKLKPKSSEVNNSKELKKPIKTDIGKKTEQPHPNKEKLKKHSLAKPVKKETVEHQEKKEETLENEKPLPTAVEEEKETEEKDKNTAIVLENAAATLETKCKTESESESMQGEKEEEEERIDMLHEEEEVFDDTVTSPCTLLSNPKRSLRRSARLASQGSGDKSREVTPEQKRHNEQEETEERKTKRNRKDRLPPLNSGRRGRKAMISSSSSEIAMSEEQEVMSLPPEVRDVPGNERKLKKSDVSAQRDSSLSPPPSKVAKRQTQVVVTRSNHQVKPSNRYYPGEEHTESEEEEVTMETDNKEHDEQEEKTEQESKKNKEETKEASERTTSQRRSKRARR